jgi:hypothetical protein
MFIPTFFGKPKVCSIMLRGKNQLAVIDSHSVTKLNEYQIVNHRVMLPSIPIPPQTPQWDVAQGSTDERWER